MVLKTEFFSPWPLIRPYCLVADFRFCVNAKKDAHYLTVLLTACQGCVIQISQKKQDQLGRKIIFWFLGIAIVFCWPLHLCMNDYYEHMWDNNNDEHSG